MKFYRNYIFLIFTSFFLQNINAQNLPNYDLENWTSSGTFINPDSWGTSNYSVFSIVTFNTVFKETTKVFSGSSSAKLVTVQKNINGDPVKVIGLITLGIFDVNLSTRKALIKGGIPFNGKPSKLSGYYQYSSPGIDSCIMSIYLTKYNSLNYRPDTLGVGIFRSGNKSEWTYFEAPIQYSSSESPDTMNIIISSSDTSLFVPGSTLYIDKLSVDATTSSNEYKPLPKKYSIYPNPASEYINIDISDISNSEIKYTIIKSDGSVLKQSYIHNYHEIIDISTFSPGIYFIEIFIENSSFKEPVIVY